MGVRKYWQQEFILDTWKILLVKFRFWLFLVTEAAVIGAAPKLRLLSSGLLVLV